MSSVPIYRNFTLIEIVAVMMIFALGVGIAVSAMRRIPAFVTMEQVMTEVKQHGAEARRTASCQHRKVSIWYDPENDCIASEEGEILLPEEMRIMAGTKNLREEDSKYAIFVFFPDGSGQGQSVKFELGTEMVTMVLSPLTGRISSKDGKTD